MPPGPAKKWRSMPLHISILTIFTVLITVLVGIVMAYNYKKNADAAMHAAERLLSEIGTSVFERTTRVFEPAFAVADQAVLLPEISLLPDVNGHPVVPVILNTLDSNPNITSMYMGYATGDFFMVSRMTESDARAYADKGVPASARYNVQRVAMRRDGTRVRVMKFMDANLHVVGSHVVRDDSYDPRRRPWYGAAIGTDRNILTDVYVYAWSREVGLTVARRFDGMFAGVFGVDIALSGVSRFLRGQLVGEDSRICMFRADGQLLAYSQVERSIKEMVRDGKTVVEAANIKDLGEPAMAALYREFEGHGRTGFPRCLFTAGGKQYMARVVAVPERYGKDHYLAIIVPLEEFTGPIAAAGKSSLLVSLGTLFIFGPLVIIVSRQLSKPIRALADEADRIRRFELAGEVSVQTRITEIRNLTRAMDTMKSTMASFTQYVPKALVERMVRLNMVPQLGGERRELTLLFSDIADFTTISETMPAEELTHLVSRYFKRLGTVILDQGGTIDKFIGDAIMAFWNAPEPAPDHAARACLAALRCQRQSSELNALLGEEGVPALRTRIGLHTGEAIVGNVGSSDRMDYTAMGGAVNIASRLEGMNKHYGTQIMASRTVQEAAGDGFLFRTVGRVVPKGAKAPVIVFELRGVRGDLAKEHPDLAVPLRDEDLCVRWEAACELYYARRFKEAAEAFEGIMAEYGEDPVGRVFLQRAKAHLDDPPDDGWDGVEVFTVK